MADGKATPGRRQAGGAGPQPEWLERALAQRGESRFADVPGGRLHYLAWNPAATHLPGLLFVHGYRAHAHFWDAIAPYFTGTYRVAAMDLSGMGDSAAREHYDARGFSDDIAAVIDHAGLGPAVVAGHSYGGARSLRAAAQYPERVRHVIAIDSICRLDDSHCAPVVAPRRRTEPFPDHAMALARYRLVPAQPCDQPWLVEHVAHHAIRPVPGGWLWKFDPALPAGPHEGDMTPILARLRIPVDYLRGEFSPVVSRESAAAIVARLPRGRGPVEIPGSYHYPMLDQPFALIAALRALLA
ncbi:alpha/beta hydrolase [Pigmentiphaga soli]|uniref:Alpha/beta hydrolase n=1 Tax=Pigmentiphaga soli TaxID=1007095 RepID=A0ABP8GC06_9BURK